LPELLEYCRFLPFHAVTVKFSSSCQVDFAQAFTPSVFGKRSACVHRCDIVSLARRAHLKEAGSCLAFSAELQTNIVVIILSSSIIIANIIDILDLLRE